MTAAGCPCGSGALYEACCGPRHDGTRPAETAEALMRSRYAAFAKAQVDYLVATHDAPATAGERRALEAFSKGVTWLGLTVHGAERGGAGDELGFVEFTARYLEGPDEVSLRERSRFRRRDGPWVYVDGTPAVTKRKVERNAPCPCGSGRKFKQCHA